MAPKSTSKTRNTPFPKIKGRKAAFPRHLEPMLATLIDKPFEQEGWIYEIKWDGYRALSLLNKGKLELLSRNNKSFNEKFYHIYNAVLSSKMNIVLDGEIVVLNEKGISDFGALQNWRSEADGDLIYYVFDILWLDGYDLMHLPLYKRKQILKKKLPKNPAIRLSESFDISLKEFLAVTQKMGLEGIMAKKESSEYSPGLRSKEWLKLKANKRHEVVIGGFTENEGTSKIFSSLLVGVYEKGRLNYIGKIGTGFNVKMQKEILSKMKPLIISKCPFTLEPGVEKPSRFRPNPPRSKVTWLKPKLVCEVSYTEMTRDGIMRHPSFDGMRIDKDAGEVHSEKAIKKKF